MKKSANNTPYLVTSKKLQIVKDPTQPTVQATKMTCSKDAEQVFRGFYDAEQIEIREEFHVLVLNRANKIIGHIRVSIGGTSGTVADGKIIFSHALQCAGASAILLSHSHPSGNTQPSEADKKLTKNLKEFGALIDLQILDHIILTENNYFSFADEGLM